MFDRLNTIVEWLAETVPVDQFIFLGSLVEEIVVPIPSFAVTAAAGSLALAEGYGPWGLAWLILLAAAGKTLGCVIIYVLSDRAEDVVLRTWGPRLGASHREVEKIGSYFKGSFRDYVLLILLRGLPVVPSLPVSIAAGVIKVPMRVYVAGSFVGCLIRSAIFVMFGYLGLSAFQAWIARIDRAESVLQIAILAAAGLGIAAAYWWRYAKFSKEK